MSDSVYEKIVNAVENPTEANSKNLKRSSTSHDYSKGNEDCDLKPPVRKEMKTQYENQLRTELQQWTNLIDDVKSKLNNGSFDESTTNLENLLTEEQEVYLQSGIDRSKWLNGSKEFRKKFQFFMKLKAYTNVIKTDYENYAMNKINEQTLDLYVDNFKCEQFDS